jgi:hypothetical protein
MTHHDLSGNLVKLDAETLLAVAQIATYRCRVEVERSLSAIQNAHVYHRDDHPFSRVTSAAQELARVAGNLAICAETAEALEGLRSRADCTVIRGNLAPAPDPGTDTVSRRSIYAKFGVTA